MASSEVIPAEDIRLAACWVDDALAGRLGSGSALLVREKRPAWQWRFFILNTSETWSAILNVAGLILLLLAFVEPARSVAQLSEWRAASLDPARDGYSVAQLSLELVLVCAFVTDIVLKVGYMGPRMWATKPWHRPSCQRPS